MAYESMLSMEPTMQAIDTPLCSFVSTAFPNAAIRVFDWKGEEALSRPYRFEVRLVSRDSTLDDEAMLGKPATLAITDAQGLPQVYHGVVTDVEQLDDNGAYFFFRVVLEPRMALLRQFRFSEIWLDSSLDKIVTDVLKEVGLVNAGPGQYSSEVGDFDFDLRFLKEDLDSMSASFTCQFEETSFDFLSRLLEYYGVYYYFEQGPSQEALVLCSDQKLQATGLTRLVFRPLSSGVQVETTLAVARTFRRRMISQASQVVLTDFSATNAQLKLQATASVADASMPVNDERTAAAATRSSVFFGDYGLHGEHFGSTTKGAWLAKRRAQALGCRSREFHGGGSATGLRAGYLMALSDHPRAVLNTQYLVVEVQHEGSQPLPSLEHSEVDSTLQCSTRFVALPANVQYRAPCSTPKPHITGVLSAIVDGDDSGKPLLNEHGCYKVIFPFVRSQKEVIRGSAWLRMVTLSSGAGHGMHFPLLKGAEVLVSFLEGDPDRPIITGTVPNSENLNRVNESNVTQSGFSSPGGSYLVVDDNKAGALMALGSPAGKTNLVMGDGAISGAHLTTQDHMELASDTYTHYVGDVYGSSIGRSSDFNTTDFLRPDKHIRDDGFQGFAGMPTPTAEQLIGGWVNLSVGGVAPAAAQGSYTAEITRADIQCTVNIGGGDDSKKNQYTDYATVLNYNKRGAKADVNEGSGYRYDHHKKEQSTAHLVKTTSYAVDTIIASIDASQFGVTTDIGAVRGINSFKITGNDHTITLDSSGLVIKTRNNAPILLDGNVVVGGCLLVKDSLQVEGDVCALKNIIADFLISNEVHCEAAYSNTGKLGLIAMPIPVATQFAKFKSDYEALYADKRGGIQKALNKLAAINNVALSLENILLQSSAAALKSPVKLPAGGMQVVYTAQDVMKKVLHTTQLVRDVVDLIKARANRALSKLNDKTISTPIINRVEEGFAESKAGIAAAGVRALASTVATTQAVFDAGADWDVPGAATAAKGLADTTSKVSSFVTSTAKATPGAVASAGKAVASVVTGVNHQGADGTQTGDKT